MQMKKALVISALATALSATSVSTAALAQSSQTTQTSIEQTIYSVNGKDESLRTIVSGDIILTSVRDLSNALGATVTAANGTVTVQFKEETLVLTAASEEFSITKVNGYNFVAADAFAEALGVTYSDKDGKPSLSSADLLEAVETSRFLASGQLLVTKTTDTGRTDYIVDAATGEYKELFTSADTSELVISPSGEQAVYSDAEGKVYSLDLSSKQSKLLSEDLTIKNELQWSADGSSLYFLQGDKSSVIAKITVADGTVSKVLEDKVDYKANLRVSADGKKFFYNVFKQPKVTADGTKDVELDDVAIDATGTEPQVYSYDASNATNKPVQLTTESEDKVFLELLADGSKAFFVSLSNNEESTGRLLSVDSSKQITTVFKDRDVYQLVNNGTKLYLLTAGVGATSNIYEVDPATGQSKLLRVVKDTVSEIVVSKEGSIVVVQDGVLRVLVEGKWLNLTK
ncbi:hypothetical protein ACFO9Q_20720 [Paenibacillus sp. GCM10023252]|uniref:hypothetical protein n=1 Tax=Paenibacillus sp. GCM10023252 TaxID=3252649 RepID=UPI00360F99FB